MDAAFFARPAFEVAPELLGALLLVNGAGGRIVEVEAYDQDDPASHSYAGLTVRNASMFGPPGRAYVYRSYGLHWCLNFVCGLEGQGTAVLVRALEPLVGIEQMQARRGTETVRLLCAGPGRLAQALGVTGEHDGLSLSRPPFEIHRRQGSGKVEVAVGPRIGISRATTVPWRYGIAGSPFLSRPFKTQSARWGSQSS